ncbi:MAG: hypothetical protein KBA05_03965 [Anaerolineaceae bacterium]|jgi:hypothetical protein|nr:hypothetical protein [Anaerolineaceae bacterium]MDI9531051.1 hypothetical protein [Chloroflexota bacterium]
MNEQQPFSDGSSTDPKKEPAGDYQEYTGPTKTEETAKSNPEENSKLGAEILSILEGFGEEIKRLSESVSEYIDKESFNKAADSIRDALNDAGEGIKHTTQTLGEKLEEERVQRAVRDLKDYAKRAGKSIQDLFAEEPSAPAAEPGEAQHSEKGTQGDDETPFENFFGG